MLQIVSHFTGSLNILLKKLNVNVKFVVYTLTIEFRIQRNK